MTKQDFDAVARATLAHYERHAEAFREGTRDHDVRQNIDALVAHIDAAPPFAILDLGCGPGRDLCALRALGHIPVGLDGASAFVAMAREASGCEVWQQDFLHLDLPAARFDGIFANATMQHVPDEALPHVLRELNGTLRPRGVFFASIPHGRNEACWQNGRYGVYRDFDTWSRVVCDAGFVLLDHYYRPAGLPRARQPWLATVFRKIAKFPVNASEARPRPAHRSGPATKDR